jgi:hypothetical protein
MQETRILRQSLSIAALPAGARPPIAHLCLTEVKAVTFAADCSPSAQIRT